MHNFEISAFSKVLIVQFMNGIGKTPDISVEVQDSGLPN